MKYANKNRPKMYKYSYSLASHYANANDIAVESRICDYLLATDVVNAYAKVNDIIDKVNLLYKDIVFELEMLTCEDAN